MNQRRDLARRAVSEALKVRRRLNIPPWAPICVFDAAENLGLEVRFQDIPSLEGLYYKSSAPIVFVSSLRPPGRQAFTCGHEIGHYIFDHGNRIDQGLSGSFDSGSESDHDELLADIFSGFLLMPLAAVKKAFFVRGMNIYAPNELDVYKIANFLGVGYETLVSHMCYGLNVLDQAVAKDLLRFSPQEIRSRFLADSNVFNMVFVDQHWIGRAIDAQVNDIIVLPKHSQFEGTCVSFVNEREFGSVFRCTKPGRGRFLAQTQDWSAFVRISRTNYIGRALFRHDEDSDYV